MVELAGLRALVVEDEGAVALLIEDMLLDLGCDIAASAAELSRACDLARSAQIDFAVLDLNLGGVSALPIARILRERRIPFVFSTGYGTTGASQEFESHPILTKPFVIADLRMKVTLALSKQVS
jgi:CheY-like chemotaxis protein